MHTHGGQVTTRPPYSRAPRPPALPADIEANITIIHGGKMRALAWRAYSHARACMHAGIQLPRKGDREIKMDARALVSAMSRATAPRLSRGRQIFVQTLGDPLSLHSSTATRPKSWGMRALVRAAEGRLRSCACLSYCVSYSEKGHTVALDLADRTPDGTCFVIHIYTEEGKRFVDTSRHKRVLIVQFARNILLTSKTHTLWILKRALAIASACLR